MNHSVTEAGKRTAFAATDVFLRMNGIALEIDDIEAHGFIVGSLEQRRLDLELVDRWLRDHVVER